MKRKNYIKIWLLSAVIAGLGAFTSCDNAEYDVLDTHAFIKEALSGTSSKVNVSVDGESKTTLNIHLSDLSTTDNHYKLVVDPSVLMSLIDRMEQVTLPCLKVSIYCRKIYWLKLVSTMQRKQKLLWKLSLMK